MSKVKVLIKEEELKKGEKDKLKGFLYGLAFARSN